MMKHILIAAVVVIIVVIILIIIFKFVNADDIKLMVGGKSNIDKLIEEINGYL